MAGDATDRRLVLLVDDDPDTLSMLISALEAAGLTALVARDGAGGLAILDRVTPDLVLLDALMPGMHGFEVCRRMKARPEMSIVPVVFMTGLGDTAHVVEGLRAGGVDYVTKPVNPDELVARIAVHIANARLVADARSALDATGQALFAVAPDGRVVWLSSRAADLLDATLPAEATARLADAPGFLRWLADASGRALSRGTGFELPPRDGGSLTLSAIGRSAAGDLLVRVTAPRGEPVPVILSRRLGLSAREGEVLSWLAQGKSNRDIAAILDVSPRTVTKHVEQIFAKLHVENRTAAAAICLRHMNP